MKNLTFMAVVLAGLLAACGAVKQAAQSPVNIPVTDTRAPSGIPSLTYTPVKNLTFTQTTLPSPTQTQTPSLTPVPIVCLDKEAQPQAVPLRQEPLEVRWISNGNIWVWGEAVGAKQISQTGDAIRFSFSPDGEVIAFEQPVSDYPWGQYKIELWAINRDGSNLRQLVSAQQFDEFLSERHEAWMANLPTDYRWFSGTHELTFGVYAYIDALGAGETPQGYWVVDADTALIKKWDNPQVIDPYGPKEYPSPDNKEIALVDRESISLLKADGSIIGKDVLTYTVNSAGEGPGWSPPTVVWSPDSLTLKVLVWEGDPWIIERFSTWEVHSDGSPAEKLHTFSGIEYYSSISPNQDYIAYLRRVEERSNVTELHLAKFDGSADVIYTISYGLYLPSWAPDSFHFIFDPSDAQLPRLGSVCGGHYPLVNPSETPATQITWVDGERFLFVAGQEGQPRELYMGQVGGASILIGPFNGDGAYYQIRQEGHEVIVP